MKRFLEAEGVGLHETVKSCHDSRGVKFRGLEVPKMRFVRILRERKVGR